MKTKFELYKDLLGEKMREIHKICNDNNIPMRVLFDTTDKGSEAVSTIELKTLGTDRIDSLYFK